jgi:hypothetical protein
MQVPGMQDALHPRLDVLPAVQRSLWPRLVEVPPVFTLYGGTAIALHLGHRQSVDFDFFAREDIDPAALLSTCSLLEGCETLRVAANTLTARTPAGVLLSFFGLRRLRPVRSPLRAVDTGLPVADLADLAASKVLAVQSRAAAKDYFDIAALIRSGFRLGTMLCAAMSVYGHDFNPLPSLKALAFFEDGDLATLDADTVDLLRREVAVVDPEGLVPMARSRDD